MTQIDDQPTSSRTHSSWATVRARTRGKAALIGGALVLGVFVVLAVLGPWLAPESLDTTVGPAFAPPSSSHWLGLDDGGQDVVSQLIYGTRQSMIIGLAAALVSGVVGSVVGVLAGYFGGWLDSVLMRLTDYVLVLPFIPLAIIVATIRGASLVTEILIIGLLLWANTARVVRAPVMSVRNRLFVTRARGMGASHRRVIVNHVLPQVTALLIATGVLAVATAIFADTAMSFLGVGVPDGASWGQMIDIAFRRGAISGGAWWAIVPPGVCVGIIVLGCSLLGRHLEQQMNPRLHVSYLNPGVATTKVAAVERAGADRTEDAVLETVGLNVSFELADGERVTAVHGIDLVLSRGERFGLVGESGCGKTTLMMAMMGLSAPNALVEGNVLLNGNSIMTGGDRSFAAHRWTDIAWIPQGAMNALNPVKTLETQMIEAVRRKGNVSRAQARERSKELFQRVGIQPVRLGSYPHEFSGGMKQRACIAMALAAEPQVLLADEPTTALDVMVQAQILELLTELSEEFNLATILVTHDLALVSEFCSRAAVMRGGTIVESGPVIDLYEDPQHPYTRELFTATAELEGALHEVDSTSTTGSWSPHGC